jgi:hypothetical protein
MSCFCIIWFSYYFPLCLFSPHPSVSILLAVFSTFSLSVPPSVTWSLQLCLQGLKSYVRLGLLQVTVLFLVQGTILAQVFSSIVSGKTQLMYYKIAYDPGETWTFSVFILLLTADCFFNSGLWGYWHCGHSWPIVPALGDNEDDCGEVDGM